MKVLPICIIVVAIAGVAVFLFSSNKEKNYSTDSTAPKSQTAETANATSIVGAESKATRSPVANTQSPPKEERPARMASADGKRVLVLTEDGYRYEDFELDPFPISKKTDSHSWTDVGGMSIEAINKIAHNEEEKERLIRQNQFIKYRELVYRNETIYDALAKQWEAGTAPSSIILPGPAGEEFKVSVKEVNYNDPMPEDGREGEMPSGGFIMGHVEGDPKSQVVVGFEDGMESGTIEYQDRMIVFNARESGQVFLMESDLEKANAVPMPEHKHPASDATHSHDGVPHHHPHSHNHPHSH